MKKILLITGVVMGILVVLILFEQTHFSSNDSNLRNTSMPMAFRKGLPSAKPKPLAAEVEKKGNSGATYFVIVKDTEEVLKGWGPTEK
ncbi:MAG: hypothetical protein ACR2MX_13000 [Cyclobacteriaceae bacterium]